MAPGRDRLHQQAFARVNHSLDGVLRLPMAARGGAQPRPQRRVGGEAVHREAQGVFFIEDVDADRDRFRLVSVPRPPRLRIERRQLRVVNEFHDDCRARCGERLDPRAGCFHRRRPAQIQADIDSRQRVLERRIVDHAEVDHRLGNAE